MTNTVATPIGRIMLRDVRISFPDIFEATVVGDDPKAKPRFGAGLLMSPDHPQVQEIKDKMMAVALDKWKDKGKAQYLALEKTNKLALHDGDTKTYDGYAGNLFVQAASAEDKRPTVLNKDRTPLTAKDGVIYAGCYVNASIDLWAQDNGFGKRINAQLRGIQFLRDGDSFSAGRPADADEFDNIEGSGADDFA
jgi:hypothetical protein